MSTTKRVILILVAIVGILILWPLLQMAVAWLLKLLGIVVVLLCAIAAFFYIAWSLIKSPN